LRHQNNRASFGTKPAAEEAPHVCAVSTRAKSRIAVRVSRTSLLHTSTLPFLRAGFFVGSNSCEDDRTGQAKGRQGRARDAQKLHFGQVRSEWDPMLQASAIELRRNRNAPARRVSAEMRPNYGRLHSH